MKTGSFLVALAVTIVGAPGSFGQRYNLKPAAEDDFSKVLVSLLNSAPDSFNEFKGRFIHTTYLGENVFDLQFKLPGCKAAVGLSRDHSISTYIEFQGYANYDEVNDGIHELSRKIKRAFGDQLYDRNSDTGQLWRRFTGYSIRDENGYYGMNLELFAGRTAFDSYLLSKDREPGTGTRHFILLKITAGLPSYYRFIKQGKLPLSSFTVALQQVIAASKQDFTVFREEGPGIKPRKTDTISLQGYPFLMRYRGSNYTATVKWENQKGQMEKLHQFLQDAVGPLYVYHEYEIEGRKAYLYFDNSGAYSSPRIYLREDEEGKYLLAAIHSPVDHPVKRHLDPEDLE